jgi:hypothetical protein
LIRNLDNINVPMGIPSLSEGALHVESAGCAGGLAKMAELPKSPTLKPNHASQLIKAAAWANDQHADHLGGIADTTTLFIDRFAWRSGCVGDLALA